MDILIVVAVRKFPNGLFTPVRGESQYGLRWASLLKGFNKVHLLTSDCDNHLLISQGIHPISETEALSRKFDVYLCYEGVWEHDVQANYKIFPAFNTFNMSMFSKYPEKAVFATPYTLKDLNPVPEKSRKALLPYIIYDTLEDSKFSLRRIAVPCRSPFADYSPNTGKAGLPHFQALLELSKLGLEIDIFCRDLLFEGTEENGLRRAAEGAVKKLISIDNVFSFDLMPYNDFLNQLSKSSVSIPCVGSANSMPESIIMGQVPLFWETWGYKFFSPDIRKKMGVDFLPWEKLTVNHIKDRILRLLEDEDYFNQQLETLRNNSAIFSKEEALEKFNSIFS